MTSKARQCPRPSAVVIDRSVSVSCRGSSARMRLNGDRWTVSGTDESSSDSGYVAARCVRRVAGVRRDVAVAGRGARRHARAAARAGTARRAATQV